MLWSPRSQTGLVVIPEELELVLEQVRESPAVHLVAYAAPVTRSMIRFGSLQYFSLPALPKGYTFPSWLVVELGILAGRLYMTFDECTAMQAYVRRAEETGFCREAVGFLLEWLSLRRVGQDMMHTPAAYVCQGRPLRKEHAFFSQGQPQPADSTVDSEASRTSSSEPSGDESDEYENEQLD